MSQIKQMKFFLTIAVVSGAFLLSQLHSQTQFKIYAPAQVQAQDARPDFSNIGTPGIDYVADRILVKFKPSEDPATIASLVDVREDRSNTFFGQIQNLQENAVLSLKGEMTPEEKMAILESTSDQVGVVATYEISLQEDWVIMATDGSLSVSESLQKYHSLGMVEDVQPDFLAFIDATPNDTDFGTLWGMEKINAEAAWDTTKGSRNIKVAVIDTGVDLNHPDLKDNVIKAISTDTTGVQCSGAFMPGSMHGTHVAGTIGAVGNNTRGVAGVNWEVSILGYCAGSDSGGLSFSAITSAINMAVTDGAKVINMSLGSPQDDRLLKTAIESAVQSGVLVVVSSGNCGRLAPGQTDSRCQGGPNCNNYVPAKYDSAFTVAATGPNNERASYSSACAAVDITAPGGNPSGGSSTCLADGTDCVRSTVPGGSYANFAGTSMSAPHVSGLAALVWAANPSLTVAQVRNVIETTATDLGTPGRDDQFGKGLINAQAAVEKALTEVGGGGGATPGASTPTPGASTPTPGGTAPTPGGATPIPHPCPDKAARGDYNCDNVADQSDESRWKDDFIKSLSPLLFWEPIRSQLY